MSNAPTPETDKLQSHTPVGTVWLEHSRSLERERDKALRELQEARNTNVNVRKERGARVMELKKELHEAREALSGRTVSCSQCNEAAKQSEAMREAIKEAHDALKAWPKAGHGMSTDPTLQSQAFRTGQAALAKLKPFLS